MVRAKFKVTGIERSMGSKLEDGKYVPAEIQTVKLSPVYGNNDPAHENTKFWQATPTGQIQLGCINADAAAAFHLDGEYYVDFTPAQA